MVSPVRRWIGQILRLSRRGGKLRKEVKNSATNSFFEPGLGHVPAYWASEPCKGGLIIAQGKRFRARRPGLQPPHVHFSLSPSEGERAGRGVHSASQLYCGSANQGEGTLSR